MVSLIRTQATTSLTQDATMWTNRAAAWMAMEVVLRLPLGQALLFQPGSAEFHSSDRAEDRAV